VPVPPELLLKRDGLYRRLKPLGRVLIAYSGGVDSAYLAWAAREALGEKMLAVIADSPSLARTQLADAVAFAREQDIPLQMSSSARNTSGMTGSDAFIAKTNCSR